MHSEPHTTHTVRDAMKNVLKIAEEITEKNLTKDVSDRTTPMYLDKCDIGWKKLTTTTSISIQLYQRRMSLTVSHASLIRLKESGMIQKSVEWMDAVTAKLDDTDKNVCDHILFMFSYMHWCYSAFLALVKVYHLL